MDKASRALIWGLLACLFALALSGCEKEQPIFPSKLYVQNETLAPTLAEGVQNWNDALGLVPLTVVFTEDRPEAGEDCSVILVRVQDLPAHVGGQFMTLDKNPCYRVLTIDPVALENLPIVMHELGHVLGLDHDTDQNSVMYKAPGEVTISQAAIDQVTEFLGL